ncbi:hypothetical protein HDF16_004517 [Granulicella aggregans]|uniref:DUF3592 domain-containing protein n=1 Tax=Granulicella aggregans TaxID=474949 RepID=A0A7W7ZHF1_9BACT|nr:hypothetical protein [Granulicella aggregans]
MARSKPEWVVAIATITGCRQTLLSSLPGNRTNLGQGDFPTYIVSFSYKANGHTLYGSYKANSPRKIGHTFEVSYDPKHPKRNTGNEFSSGWIRAAVWIVVGCLGALAAWFKLQS